MALLGRFDFDIFGKSAFWYSYCVALILYLAARLRILARRSGARRHAGKFRAILRWAYPREAGR